MKRKLLGFTKSIVVLRSFATMLLFISAFTVGWGDNYLIWKSQSASTWTESSLGSSDEVTITLEANVSYEFYLKDGSSNLWKFSNDATFEITDGTGYTLVKNTNGYNGTITNAAAGNYKFKPAWNNGTPTLTVTFPVVAYTPVLDKANEISCFYEVGSNDYSYIYVWNGDTKYAGGFPGTQMTQVGTTADGKKIYKWTYTGSETKVPANVIFSLGNSSGQTQNLEFKNHGYYIDGTWDREITAVAETKYTVTISAGDGGTVSPSGDQQVGSTPVSITAFVSTGYTFSGWTKTGGVEIAEENNANTTITATSPGTVTANFKANTSSTTFYLPNSGNNNFERNDNCKFVDGQLTLNLTAGFKFKVCKNSGTETWYGDGSTISATTTDKEITKNIGDMTLTVSQPGTYTFKVEEISGGVKLSVTYPSLTHTVKIEAGEGGSVTPTTDQTVGSDPVTITATANSGYTFEKWTSSSTGIKIADAYSPSTTITATADGTVTANFTATSSDPIYYVVFPDANVGNTARADKTVKNIPDNHTAFRLIPSRNRNAKTLDEDLLSINLKIDGGKGRQLRYDTEGKIKFYITDGNGKYLTGSGVSGTEDNLSLTSANANNGVDGYVTRDGSVSDGLPGYYYTISENSAIGAKSLTFMFSNNNKTDKDYIINSGEKATTIKEPSNSVDGFGTDAGMKSGNLIVGFLTTRGHGSNYYTDHISNGVYLVGKMNGEKYTRDKNYPMKKILYPLGMTDEAAADSIVYSCTVKKGSANWDDFFLSFSTGDKVEDGDKLWNLLLRPSVQNQMDGQALEGGVTFFKNDNGTDNAQQALNPLLSDAQKNRYVSYTIYFNATYSTYRIEFHDGFYIAGAAVSESGSYAPDKRIAMSSAELNGVQHYTYTGEFKNGEQFAFFLNEDSYAVNYCEDNQPVSSTSETDAWNVQAPEGGADYAFYNHVLYNENGDNDEKNLGTDKSGMTWGLPTGTYTIRFYNHKEAKNNNQLYTVDKEVTMAHVTSTFKDSQDASDPTVHNYGGWRTLSDDCALILPYGIKAYYAAKVGNGKVYLKELTEGYIPAHCPVILSNPNLLARSKSIAFPVCPDDYAKKLANTETNYLVDCYKEAGTVDPVVTGEDSKTKYNYFFSYRFKFEGSRVMSDVPLGFWKPFAGTATKKNYSYLSIDTELNPSRYDEDTYTFEYNATESVVSTKAYCFRMVFDEDELDDNTTTGIEKVTDNADVDMKNAVWYNMQGVRISKPAAPGMYICNGKKIVVR